jgi:cation:H+ antiporter
VLTFGAIALGMLLLICGGTALVHGASQIATRFGISPMVIGLTVVALGTSLPELIVNMIGAARGATELAFGNVVGSNVANVALVLGVSAVIRPITIRGSLVQRELPLLLLATAILTIMALDTWFSGAVALIDRPDAVILLLVFSIFMYITIKDVVRSQGPDALLSDIDTSPLVPTHPAKRWGVLQILGGIVLLYVGGEMTVINSIELAARLQVPQAILGLFVLALGTSLPELVTSIVAAFRSESDLALGNVVGSNLFNTLLVLPATAIVATVRVPQGGVGDLVVSLVCVAALIPVFVFGNARLGRITGAGFVVLFVGWAIIRTTM